MPNKKGNNFEAVVIGILASLCLGISFFLMAFGYRALVPSPKWLVAGVAALIVVMALALLNLRIRRARQTNEGFGKLALYFGFYLVVTVFSFFGNFNAIYPTFMGSELLRTELQEKRDQFNILQESAKSKLGSVESLRPKLDGLISQLDSQIRNPEEPGCGPKCDKILDQIEALLNAKITRLKGDDKNALIREYNNIVEKEYEAMASVNNDSKRKELIAFIDNLSEQLKPKINEAIANPTENDIGRETLKEVVEDYKEIGTRTQSLVGEQNFKYDKNIRVKNEELGKISHTLGAALENIGSFGTWVAIILSLLFDLFVPVIILVMTTPNTVSNYRYPYQPTEI